MFGIGTGELLLLLVIALIVLGPERMPKLARDLGRAIAEFRRTSDELRSEFLNADKYLGAASAPPDEPPAIAAPAGTSEPALTEAAVATDVPTEPDETLFDKEAREARERLRDPERAERAKAEGWATPTDDAGTSERWG
ncbi:MAG TPA: twin-arginine translocase TatA/TatE family subunit [Candidatus Limnocylindria bacterium]|nr:twin-arginine translocase TatA/TatE family subunit [Candidatus Limnocylindria bacterium]